MYLGNVYNLVLQVFFKKCFFVPFADVLGIKTPGTVDFEIPKSPNKDLGRNAHQPLGDGEGRGIFREQAVLALGSRKMSGHSHREEGECEQRGSLSECLCDSGCVHWCAWCVQGCTGERMLSHGPSVAPALSLHHLPEALD